MQKNTPNTPEFKKLVKQLVEIRKRDALLGFPEKEKDPEGKWIKEALESAAIPKTPEDWQIEQKEQYTNLRILATAFHKALEASKKYGSHVLVVLMSD